MQSAIVDTLLLLGYEKYQSTIDTSRRSAGDLRQLFVKPSESVIFSVVHFLLGRLDSRRANGTFRTLFPPKTPVQARDFRQAAVTWLQELEGAGVLPENAASISVFISPSPAKITRFLWALSSHVFRVVAEREAGVKDPTHTRISTNHNTPSSSYMAQAVARAELFAQRRHAAEVKEQEALKALSVLENRLSELKNKRDMLSRDTRDDFEEIKLPSAGDIGSLHNETEELLLLLKRQKENHLKVDPLGASGDGIDVNSVLNDFENKFMELESAAGWRKLVDGINFRGGAEHLVSSSTEYEALEREKLCSASSAAEAVEQEVESLSKSTTELKARVEAKALSGLPVGQELPSNKDTRALVLAAVEDINVVIPGKAADAATSTPSKRRKSVVAVTPNTVAQNRKRAARRISLIVNRLQKKRNSSGFLLNFDEEDEDDDLGPHKPKKSKGNL